MSLAKRNKIIAKLALKYGMSKKDTEEIVRSQIEHLRNLMKEGKYMGMIYKGFGKFHVLPARIPLYAAQLERNRIRREENNEKRRQQQHGPGIELLENQSSTDDSGPIQETI